MAGRSMLLILNHKLLESQIIDARENLSVDKFIEMPGELADLWERIDPAGPLDVNPLGKIAAWIDANARPDDYILVHGEFGAVFYLVDYCLSKNLNPVYATTERRYSQELLDNGDIANQHIFHHAGFRRYRKHTDE
jgi:hypothetical protein